jgi:hypothetical protein
VCAARFAAGGDLGELIGPTLGFEVIAWMETFLVHGPGDVQGQPYHLDPEFGHLLLHAYELRDDGRRMFRRVAVSRPKGRAKSELGGAVACAELLGPVRFDGWDANGDPVGRPITAPRVLLLATEEGQADNTYEPASYMLANGPAADEYRLDVGLTRVYSAGGGELVKDTSAPTSADGARTTHAGFDETHLYASLQLRNLHATVRRNLGKRAIAEPWSMETTTRYRPGEESVAEVLDRHWQRILAGEFGDPAEVIAREGLLVDHREAPPVELDDDDALELALRDVYGAAAEWIDVSRIIAEIRDPQSAEEDSRRYWLNQAVRAADHWLEDVALWDRLAIPRTIEPGTTVALGFDGSQSDDATVLIACTIDRDGTPYTWPLGVWEAPEDPRERAEWTVDREAVNAAVQDAFDTLDVCLLYADPPYWVPEIAAWASAYGTDVVREFATSRDYRMAPAQESLRTAIEIAALEHRGDAVVSRHMANARTRSTRHGTTVRKDRPASPRKIDACVGTALAYQARCDVIAGDLDLHRRKRRRKRGQRSQLYAF